jgi:parvulin-like peptidyl-prolyl isomerase
MTTNEHEWTRIRPLPSFVFIRVHSWLITALCILFISCATAEVMDRIAVAVGNRAIKESQIDREVRLTAFENGTALDLSAASKRKAADRLIDQTFIRAEMAKASYSAPSDAEINSVLDRIKQTRFRSNAEFEQALKTYAIATPELKAHIAWQIQVLRFADLHFEPIVRKQAVANVKQPLGDRVNAAFFAWLDESRKNSRIQFHEDVFQ